MRAPPPTLVIAIAVTGTVLGGGLMAAQATLDAGLGTLTAQNDATEGARSAKTVDALARTCLGPVLLLM